ncbi:MAG: hypothetical protein ACLR20_08095 [Bifidobacterium longum]
MSKNDDVVAGRGDSSGTGRQNMGRWRRAFETATVASARIKAEKDNRLSA